MRHDTPLVTLRFGHPGSPSGGRMQTMRLGPGHDPGVHLLTTTHLLWRELVV